MTTEGRSLEVIEKTFEVIEYLWTNDGARVTEIASDLGMPPSTVHNHLSTLTQLSVLTQENEVYYLGLAFLRYGRYVQQRTNVYRTAEKYVQELIDETGYRSVFVVEENGQAAFLHTRSGQNPSWKHAAEGERESLHLLAAGKAILAHLPPAEVDEIVRQNGLDGRTSQSITDPATLDAELETVRERGYALNLEENTEGVHAVGVPAKTTSGRVVGGFSVSGPSNRLTESELEGSLPDEIRGIVNEFELELELA